MKLNEVQQVLNAKVVCGWEWLDKDIVTVCGADLMSDVLAFTKEKTLLLTGLTNIQVVRTAEMSDLVGIVFVRGKRPGMEVIQLAQAKSIPLFITDLPMYEACGVLFRTGIEGCSKLVMHCDK